MLIVDGKKQYLFDETGRRFLDVRARMPALAAVCRAGTCMSECASLRPTSSTH